MFLGDNVKFSTSSELYNFIHHVLETHDKYVDEINLSIFNVENILRHTYDRLINHCGFIVTKDFENTLYELLMNLSDTQLVMLYYRNNFIEFTQLPYIHNLYHRVIDPLENLEVCEYKAISDEDAKSAAKELNHLYVMYVYYDYPVYDRLRKAMYTDKNTSLYTDTDSIFLSLNKATKYIENEIIKDTHRDPVVFDVLCMNLLLIFMNDIIARALATLCKYMNVDSETAKALNMKNEFVFLRILFTDRKKRYISLAIYQEGQLLNKGKGLPEIKGFDFIKSTTKPIVKEFYQNLAINDILLPKEINTAAIYKKILDFKHEIHDSMVRGESTYFKQANVQTIDHYKKPYSNQGTVSILVWNALCPDYAIELPSDVDIVPIINLTYPKPDSKSESEEHKKKNVMIKTPIEANKNIAMVYEKYPDLYQLLYDNFYSNSNPLIKHMSITSMAKPKNDEIPIPEWFSTILNSEKIVEDTIGLFLPILNVLGLKSPHTTSSRSHLSNLVHL